MPFHNESDMLDHLQARLVVFGHVDPDSVEPLWTKGVVQKADECAGAVVVMPQVFPAYQKVGPGFE